MPGSLFFLLLLLGVLLMVSGVCGQWCNPDRMRVTGLVVYAQLVSWRVGVCCRCCCNAATLGPCFGCAYTKQLQFAQLAPTLQVL
jgi:hypothetical protein